MPFGGGARVCIGNHFALLELQLVLAVLAQRRRFQVVDWRPLRLEPTVTLRPRDPVRMRVEPR
jgi:cytochrome P450